MESTSDLPDDCSLALDEEEKESLALVSCNQVIINNMLTSKFVKYYMARDLKQNICRAARRPGPGGRAFQVLDLAADSGSPADPGPGES